MGWIPAEYCRKCNKVGPVGWSSIQVCPECGQHGIEICSARFVPDPTRRVWWKPWTWRAGDWKYLGKVAE